MRNAEATLGIALRSVQRQTHENFECLVVDDGSHDGSAALARAVACVDARFRVLDNPSPGLVAALNLGVQNARGEWLARLDADDCMHRQRLAEQLRAVRLEPSWQGAGCHVRVFPRNHLEKGRLEYERWLNSMTTAVDVRNNRFVECPLAHPTWFLKRALLLEFPYRNFAGPEDYDVLLRVHAAGHRIGVVPRRLVCWRDQPGRLSRLHPRYEVARFVELKASHLASEFLHAEQRYVLIGYGRTGKELARTLRGLGHHPSHIVEVHPGRIGQTIAGAPVIPLDRLQRLTGARCIVCVAGLEARMAIRRVLRQMALREDRDFVCAA